jgi:hypothetical protein
MSPTQPQRTAPAPDRPVLAGPVVVDLAHGTTPAIAALDARWAATVLAGQALDYAVTPPPDEALADVLRMLGLTAGPLRFGRQA